jgi:hypothetical protein
MIFQFPDLETFRLAVTSAQVPPDVSAAPAEVAFDPAGRPSVRSVAGIPPRPMQNALRKLGVKSAREHYSDATVTVECWPQVLPVTKAGTPPEVTPNTPVLFEMPVSEMPAVVTEMLRLGNDRQSFRAVTPVNGRGERVLLKVLGPPYYTLLRAIDQTHMGSDVTAFVEKASGSGVWIQIGYDHALAAQIRPATGQILLLRPEREWTAVEDGPFQDVYEVLDFKLPAASVEWQESHLRGKLTVPLRLVPGNAADVPEMWVLTKDAVDQLDALVRDADERLMARLSFAVAREPDGRTTIVLRTRPSKLSPPVLSLAKAHVFKPYWKLPNLFLPVGRRLMPTMRRDAVRKKLADNPDQVVWLMPGADGRFTPEMLPDEAFRPLEDWIDYVIDHEREPLKSWVQATHFDFESFVCRDEGPDKPKAPPDKGKKNKKGGADPDSADADLPPIVPKGGRKKAQASATDEADFLAPAAAVAPNELKVQLRALEDQFKSVEGPLDAPERVELWSQIARLNAALRDTAEAAICWTNAFWELPEVPPDASLLWLRSEDPQARSSPTAEEFDAAVSVKLPSPHEVRALAARVVHACKQVPVTASFVARLPKVRDYLERYEGMLGVRTVWLAWWHLAGVGGAAEDVKAVAHVRDRLLQRLLGEGLNKERDLPYFLRMSGEQNSERMRLVRDRAMQVHRQVERWHAGEDVKVNKPYVDLMFAFGLAKLGEVTSARDLMKNAVNLLTSGWHADPIQQRAHDVLAKAFTWRIEQVLQGKPHQGPLPQEITREIQVIDQGRSQQGVNPKYIVERLIEQSWVLEPEEAIDPYSPFKSSFSKNTIAELQTIRDPKALKVAIDRAMQQSHDSLNLLDVALSAANLVHRVGEDYAIAFVSSIPTRVFTQDVPKGPGPHVVSTRIMRAELLSRILFIAAHYGRPELVDKNLDLVYRLLADKVGEERYEILNIFAHRSVRHLRRLGLKEQIDRLLKQIRDLVEQGKTLSALRSSTGQTWPDVLGSLLCLAEGWQFFGAYDLARPYLDEARATIYGNGKAPQGKSIGAKNIAFLVQRYVAAASQGPIDDALGRIEDLFKHLERLPNTYSTSSHYSRLHLNIVEEVVRSLMTDNMALGDQARRWLDDDEFLVRRRIHRDMKSLLSAHGL